MPLNKVRVEQDPVLGEPDRISAALNFHFAQCIFRIVAMVLGYELGGRPAQIGNEMLFERNDGVVRMAPQSFRIKGAERIGHERNAYELIGKLIKVGLESGPIDA